MNPALEVAIAFQLNIRLVWQMALFGLLIEALADGFLISCPLAFSWQAQSSSCSLNGTPTMLEAEQQNDAADAIRLWGPVRYPACTCCSGRGLRRDYGVGLYALLSLHFFRRYECGTAAFFSASNLWLSLSQSASFAAAH